MSESRILALYLPQFHRTAENDAWWGEGFTDWTAVRQAKALFPGHNQPHAPLDGNYYDLLSKDTMLWQANLMHTYGVDGMIFYHYYFKNGRRILERPAENLLRWTDVEMPFCFSWANESWVRSWSNISGNHWSEVVDRGMTPAFGDTGLLLEQKYGGREAWEEHFRYLLPFFKDGRYIRQQGKPVFFFYRPQSIDCLKEMIRCWRDMALEAGLPGLYLMAAGADRDLMQFLDEALVQEPQEATNSLMGKGRFQNEKSVGYYLEYDEVWQKILTHRPPSWKTSFGGFTNYDDSPRRGYNATVVHGKTAEKFQRYMMLLLKKAAQHNASFVVLNAWNEWGEGMYLEPDEEEGYAYLEALQEARRRFEDGNLPNEIGLIKNENCLSEEIESLRHQVKRYHSFWHLLNGLLLVKEQGISIARFLRGKGYARVGIYGMGMIGKHLATLLKQDGMAPVFALDQSRNILSGEFPVLCLKDEPMAVDLIIVTVTYDFQNIKKKVSSVYDCKIVSLNTVLDEIAII